MPDPKDVDKVDQYIKDAAMTPEAQRRYSEYRGRRDKELRLWEDWDRSGRPPEKMQPLLQSLNPLIKREATNRLQGLGGSIPRAALENELRNAAARAIQTFDPSKGAKLPTHVHTNFQRITDFVAANRNEKYMPREDVERKQSFDSARLELVDELGREPTVQELQQKLPGWSQKRIQKMLRGFGPEVYTDMGTEFDGEVAMMRPRDAFQLMRSRLSPEEQSFGELHFPAEGAPPGIKNIARALGIPEHKAYRLKSRVEQVVGNVLKKE